MGHSYEMFWQFFLQGNKFYNHSKVNRVLPMSLALIHCYAHTFYLKLIASMISFFFSRANFFNDSTNICLRKSSWDYSSQRRVYIILNVLLLIPVCLTDTDIYSKRNFQMKTIRNELNEFLSVEQLFSQARNNSRRKYQVKANHLVRIEQFSTECHRKSKTKVITTEKSEPRLTSSLTNENSK